MNERIVAVVTAAGKGTRMGADKNKLLLEVSGRPVLAWTLEAFEGCPLVDEVLIVANEQDIFSYRDIVVAENFRKVTTIVCGGETRAESVYRGICAAENADIVIIHDGARPLVTPAIIADTVEGSRETGAAIAAVRAVDTIKRVENGIILETPDRETIWQAQTPQVFRRSLILEAMENCVGTITDDASAAEKMGERVRVIDTGYENIKITTPFDLILLEAVLEARKKA
ncbi:MAG: 2-C-methyl-D-erythritol 4-phosphate cytidylyltransferase [Ruminococcaceae bacterium]|nr:2-C-methyl-D-erythritol 4-phosphate cytidylyltransferase [Oscillospiraceae bacterium]